ncbi:unnamed protein product [Ambrosiozyma monospora]|uniref:Unnamed protein product n=1 Tax=Ambrosiozyma monospora TaxID=43982 RepID=A0A9W6YTM6_AMBMO|nr:unnamed protein product [Ambrosiozyma monospora]
MGKDINITIPDLRYENTFLTKVKTNAKKTHKAKLAKQQGIKLEEVHDDETQLAPISPSIVIYTVLQDQLMQLVQGFGMALGLILLKPVLGAVFASGRRAGNSFVAGIKSIGAAIIPTDEVGFNHF